MPALDSILVLDPDLGPLRPLEESLATSAPHGCRVRLVASSRELLEAAEDRSHRLLVFLPAADRDDSPADLIARLRDVHPGLPVVVVAQKGDVESASSAIASGATDFLVLGDRLQERIATLLGKLRGLFQAVDRNRLLDEQNAALRQQIAQRFDFVGSSPQIRELLATVERVASIPRPVLVIGERGTGKEVIARAIHLASGRPLSGLVTVNCAAFNDALLESELFGHEKGAFTGADSTQRGKFEQADGGTLFLDEIGNMSLAFQQKILRVVEYGVFTRVGGLREIKTTARIVAATNADLGEKMEAGEFLSDLHDRLSFEVLRVPPLRERREDIEELALHFLHRFAREIPAFRGKTLSSAALERLRRYPFPGNIRELKNVIERAAYRDTTNEITPKDLGLPADDDADIEATGSFTERLDVFARRLLRDALEASGGNQAEAARRLGLSYAQFRHYRQKHLDTS